MRHSVRMRRCFDTAWRVVSKCAANAPGVMACRATRPMMARRVGSAMAWKTSRLMGGIGYMQLNGCVPYMQPFGYAIPDWTSRPPTITFDQSIESAYGGPEAQGPALPGGRGRHASFRAGRGALLREPADVVGANQETR